MPEFEESDSQPDPAHNYTPSTGAPKNKGGRRRSGGFKSETSARTSNIGEVDPTEILNTKVKQGPSQPESKPDAQASGSTKSSKPSGPSLNPNSAKRSADTTPQPSEATLASIKRVEEKIAKRSAEDEKDYPAKDRRNLKEHDSQPRKNGTKVADAKGGLFAIIGQFFSTLLGGGTAKQSVEDQERRPRKRHSSGSNNRHRGNGQRSDDSGKRHRNHRGGSKNRRRRAPQKK